MGIILEIAKEEYGLIIMKALIAVCLSGVIGMERQSKQRPAGFRTHILVCIGSMAVMILSQSIFEYYNTHYGITTDPSRMSAQVISGIGFLGAGTIINQGAHVKGLTTAASLWVVAAIGLAVGAGHFPLAIIVTITIYVTLLSFNKISKYMSKYSNTTEIIIKTVNQDQTIGSINLTVLNYGGKILDLEVLNNDRIEISEQGYKFVELRLIFKSKNNESKLKILEKLEEVKGIIYINRI